MVNRVLKMRCLKCLVLSVGMVLWVKLSYGNMLVVIIYWNRFGENLLDKNL